MGKRQMDYEHVKNIQHYNLKKYWIGVYLKDRVCA
jgi:hypothetical protein